MTAKPIRFLPFLFMTWLTLTLHADLLAQSDVQVPTNQPFDKYQRDLFIQSRLGTIVYGTPADKRVIVQQQRRELIESLKQLQDAYCRAAMLDQALSVREQIRRLQADMQKPLPAAGPVVGTIPETQLLGNLPYLHRGKNNKLFYAKVTGSNIGSVWGDGIYTDDSSLATAAVHAGALKHRETRFVSYTILPGRKAYHASTKNGVTTGSWGQYPGSYRINGAGMELTSVREHRGQTDKTIIAYVTARKTGVVWGSGPYTDDSDLGTAAAHAGLLKTGAAGFIKVTLRGAQDSYTGSTKNGITTSDYGPWEGSFVLDAFQQD